MTQLAQRSVDTIQSVQLTADVFVLFQISQGMQNTRGRRMTQLAKLSIDVSIGRTNN